MKFLAILLTAVLFLCGVNANAKSKPEPGTVELKTYGIIGDPHHRRPTAAQARQAFFEINPAMEARGYYFTENPDKADVVIKVRFMREKYEIDFNEFIPNSKPAAQPYRGKRDDMLSRAQKLGGRK